jgi:DNA-binding LacI/PurR family transcriptional regulator
MGYEAVRLLLELIEDPHRSGPIHITLPTTLVVRQSCRPLTN